MYQAYLGGFRVASSRSQEGLECAEQRKVVLQTRDALARQLRRLAARGALDARRAARVRQQASIAEVVRAWQRLRRARAGR